MITIRPLSSDAAAPPSPAPEFSAEGGPPLKHWRTNLTALSWTCNLYFVARAADIYVYEPSFPHQHLHHHAPVLVISTPPSAPHLRGYLDCASPHAINNLLVHALGHEEVLAIVRDDGDTDAYLVRHIVAAVACTRHKSNLDTSLPPNVKPFFHRNVGNSAWGLAVHTSARLIAVSSNNHEINVFSFALLGAEHDPATLGHDLRGRDEHIRLHNGGANIPFVAFCNTADDPGGDWLLSVDISGLLRSWNIRTRTSQQCLYVGRVPRTTEEFNRFAAGWTASFMDPRLFRETKSWAAVGFDLPALRPMHSTCPVWDTSEARRRDGLTRLWDQPATPRRAQGVAEHVSPEVAYAVALVNSSPSASESDDDAFDSDGLEELAMHESFPAIHVDVPSATPDAANNEVDDESYTTTSGSADLVEVLDAGPPSNTFPPYTMQRKSGHRQPVYVKLSSTESICPLLPCPLLVTSVTDMYLIQPSSRHYTDHLPIVFMGDYLQQELSDSTYFAMQGLYDIDMFERCSLIVQIPALGVVIVGDQKGRVAVLSAFKIRQHVKLKEARSVLLDTVKWVYGLKLQAILPLPAQEARGLRPLEQLYGIAAAPMQGSYNLPPDQMRWRLIMMYRDETMLSYDIGKKEESDELQFDDVI